MKMDYNINTFVQPEARVFKFSLSSIKQLDSELEISIA